jgi:hypothetical protein
VNAYTGGTQTTIVSSITTSSSVTYNFTTVLANYYFFTVYQVTSAYGQSPTFQSAIFNYVWVPTAAATPLAMWLRGNSGLNTSGSTWTDPNSSTSYTITGTATTVTVNGLNACQFTSGSGYIATTITWANSGRTVFLVIQMPAYVTSGTLYIFSGPFANNNNTYDFRWISVSSTTARIAVTYQGNGTGAPDSSIFTQLPAVPVVYSVVTSGSGTNYYINGTAIGTPTIGSGWSAGSSTQSINAFNFGSYIPNANGNNIYCEVVVYNGALGATDMTNCITYLRNKWGTS